MVKINIIQSSMGNGRGELRFTDLKTDTPCRINLTTNPVMKIFFCKDGSLLIPTMKHRDFFKDVRCETATVHIDDMFSELFNLVIDTEGKCPSILVELNQKTMNTYLKSFEI